MVDLASTSSPLAESSRTGLKRARSESQSESFTATRPRLVVSQPDRVEHATQTAKTDDAHFDKAVLSSMDEMGWEPESSGRLNLAKDLLRCIVKHSKNQLHSKFKNPEEAAKFLRDNGDVFEQLKAAWETKTFVEIRQHRLLRAKKPFTGLLRTKKPVFFPKSNLHIYLPLQKHALSNAWKEPYCGKYHEILYGMLNQMERGKPYSNTVSIIQSSGTGKSRMVDQLGHLVFTIPFNIRGLSEMKEGLAYPPPDEEVGTFLTKPTGFTVEHVQSAYMIFLKHVFDEIQKVLEKDFCTSALTHTALSTSWRTHLEGEGTRPQLYKSIVEASKESYLQWQRSTKDMEFDELVKDLEKGTRDAFEALSSAIDKCIQPPQTFKPGDIKVVMYFDESHTLSNKSAPNDPDDKSLMDVLCTAVDHLCSEPFFVIFLAPSQRFVKSARDRQHRNSLQTPITEVAFDCSPKLNIDPDELTLEDTSSLEFMAQFGRPLFWSMIAAAGNRKEDLLKVIVDLARSKLLGQNMIDDDLKKKEGAVAVVDLRLMLDYDTRREDARSAEKELVTSHMRMAYAIPKTWETVASGYPSEPVLAEAAAQQTRVFRSRDPNIILKTLRKNMTSGILDRGKREELVAREILTSAYDRAIEREFSDLLYEDSSADTASSRIPFYGRGVSLITFIEELFASPFAELILDSLPNNVPKDRPGTGGTPDNVSKGIKFREPFKEAKVRFTHFGKMGDDMGTTTAAVRAAVIRGMAIICVGETLIDFIIPVILRNSKLRDEVITGILGSIRRRQTKGADTRYEIDEKEIGFFPPSDDPSQLPYINLVMELGVPISRTRVKGKAKSTPKIKTVSAPEELSMPNAPITSLPSALNTSATVRVLASGTRQHPTSQHPRYSIFAYGCSKTVYKGIIKKQQPLYNFLLGSKNFMDEHPREGEALAVIRRMKPFWTVGEDCHHWLRDDRLREEAAPHFKLDRLVVGGPELDKGSIGPSTIPTPASSPPPSLPLAIVSTGPSVTSVRPSATSAEPSSNRPPKTPSISAGPSAPGHKRKHSAMESNEDDLSISQQNNLSDHSRVTDSASARIRTTQIASPPVSDDNSIGQAVAMLQQDEPDLDHEAMLAIFDLFKSDAQNALIYVTLKKNSLRKLWVRREMQKMDFVLPGDPAS